MKKISLSVVLLVMGVLLLSSGQALAGAYDELLPEAVKGKPFVPSIKLRVEYDDNIYTTTDLEKATYGVTEEESAKFYLEPKIDLHWLSATSYLGLSYQFSLIYYADRAQDDTDMAHDVLLDLRHRFSPAVEIAVRDLFRHSEEPEIAEQIVTAGGMRTIPYQKSGEYDYNRASVGLNLQPSPQVALNINYANLMIDYDDDASFYYDRDVNSIGGKLQYIATPESKINLGVTYADVDYDADALMKDSESIIAYIGLDQSLTRTAVASIAAGWENRDFSDVDLTEDVPFVDVSLASKLGKKGNGRIGYRYGLAETEHASFGVEEAHTIYAGLNAWLAQWTSLHVNTSYEMGEFDKANIIAGRGLQDQEEDAWLLGLVLRQHVSKSMYLEAGYRHTDIDSDFAGSAYSRNRYYVGFGGIF